MLILVFFVFIFIVFLIFFLLLGTRLRLALILSVHGLPDFHGGVLHLLGLVLKRLKFR